jgi:hypothetical protein
LLGKKLQLCTPEIGKMMILENLYLMSREKGKNKVQQEGKKKKKNL